MEDHMTSRASRAATRDHSLAAGDAGEVDLVERVAEALALKAGLIWDHLDEDATSVEESRDHWREHARAAIEAMREPSQAMLDAVCTDDPNGAPFHDNTIREVFREMIDAALKPAAP